MDNQFEHLLEKIKLINFKYDKVLNNSHSKFNVFSILRNESDEEKLHSTFIGELLNPKGSHGFGDEFLKLFCEITTEANQEIKFNNEKNQVIIEKGIGNIRNNSTEGGRIDIYISDGSTTIAIENKIYAEDQYKQLLRYHNYIKNDINSRLIYLTLDRAEPSDDSKGNLKESDYIKLSYKEDIRKWLELCKQKVVDYPLLRETIQQYINLIKKLTGTSLDNNYIMDIAKVLTESSSNLKLARGIIEAFDEAKIEIQYKFWESLSESLEGKFDKEYSKEMITAFYKQSRNNRYYAIKTKIVDFKNHEIYFRVEINHNIYFGFCVYTDGEHSNECENEEFVKINNFIKNNFSDHDFKQNQWWLGWEFPIGCRNQELNFNSFNSNQIYELADSDKMKELTDRLAKEINNLISEFKNEFKLIQK